MPGCARPARMRGQALRHESPVVVVEAHHVGDRAERHEVEQTREVRLRAAGESAARAQLRPQLQHRIEHDTDAGQVLARKPAAGLIRIDDASGAGRRSPGR